MSAAARRRRRIGLGLAVLALALSMGTGSERSDAETETPSPPPEKPDPLISGYHFARPDTQAIQDDAFSNPGYLWIDRGAALWREADGDAGKSCADCHGDAETTMAGVGATYPKVDGESGRLVNLSQRINQCRVRHMAAAPWEPRETERESAPLVATAAYVMHQSRGLPLNVSIDGPARPFFERGHRLYHQRVGQTDLACTMCHDDRVGHYLRAEHISQGHLNGFPAYVMRWDSMATAHRRFQFCNEQARAEPLPIGHADYNALQLYVTWRGNGLAIESPAVRR